MEFSNQESHLQGSLNNGRRLLGVIYGDPYFWNDRVGSTDEGLGADCRDPPSNS